MSLDPVSTAINKLAQESVSALPDDCLFNFCLDECFYLNQNLSLFKPITDDVKIAIDHNNGTIAWGTNFPRRLTGVILRLQVIPSLIYHLFIDAKVLLGTEVKMFIRNHLPEVNLSQEQVWKIGNLESKSVCFRALTHQVDILFLTVVDCVLPLVPFAHVISSLTIIPDTKFCPGYFNGQTGLTGFTGINGVNGEAGLIGEIGLAGDQGPEGATGLIGSDGSIGSVGSQGSQGFIGSVGFVGDQTGATGFQGITGPFGLMGAMGSVGFQGVQGFGGVQGNQGEVGDLGFQGPHGFQGNMGDMGDGGVTGPLGILVVNDSFFTSWSRGGPPLAFTLINYVRIGNRVTIQIPEFTAGASVSGSPLNASTSLPPDIQTGITDFFLFPIVVEVDTVPTMVSMRIGPVQMEIYSTLDTGGFFGETQTVVVPAQTLTYLIV